MNRIASIYRWDLEQGLRNRFLQVFAVVCLAGGAAILAAAPGRETLPLILIQAVLFFGSLFGFLVGWSSGQQARTQGAFLFAQPFSAGELVLGKLLGTGTWCMMLVLFMVPAALSVAMPATMLTLGALALGFVLVCLQAGLLIGLIAAPVSGLFTVFSAWVVMVAGWELGLLVLSGMDWIQRSPGVFVTLLLINPAGAFRVGTMVGLDTVPFDASELETGRIVFENIKFMTACIFALWLAMLFSATVWMLSRQEF